MSTTMSISDLRQKAKLPARQAGGVTVSAFFDEHKASIAAVLPKHVSPERLLKVALGAIRTTPKLLGCTVESLFGAVVQCAQLGLEPNTPLGHAYMIPFENSWAKRVDVQVIIGYRGLIELARRSGQIISIAAHAVYEHDHFDFAYGLDDRLEHRPTLGDRGEIIAFYAVAKLKDGGHAFEVMPVSEVNAIRDVSSSYRSAVKYGKTDTSWIANYPEMGRKTAVRRLAKYLPVSIELAIAAELDDLADAEKPQALETALSGEWAVVQEDASDMPEAQQPIQTPAVPPQAIQEPPAPAAPPRPAWPRQVSRENGSTGWQDSDGTHYDPARHGWSTQLNRPSVTASGQFRARRGASSDSTPPPPQEETVQPDDGWVME